MPTADNVSADEKSALVTRAGRAIGYVISETPVDFGVTAHMVDWDPGSANTAAEKLEGARGKVSAQLRAGPRTRRHRQ